MDHRLKRIRDRLWETPSDQQMCVQKLEEEICRLKPRVFEIINNLSENERIVIEKFIYDTAELELYTVIQAYRRGQAAEAEIC